MVVSKSCENSFYKAKVMCILCLGHIEIGLVCARKATGTSTTVYILSY